MGQFSHRPTLASLRFRRAHSQNMNRGENKNPASYHYPEPYSKNPDSARTGFARSAIRLEDLIRRPFQQSLCLNTPECITPLLHHPLFQFLLGLFRRNQLLKILDPLLPAWMGVQERDLQSSRQLEHFFLKPNRSLRIKSVR